MKSCITVYKSMIVPTFPYQTKTTQTLRYCCSLTNNTHHLPVSASFHIVCNRRNVYQIKCVITYRLVSNGIPAHVDLRHPLLKDRLHSTTLRDEIIDHTVNVLDIHLDNVPIIPLNEIPVITIFSSTNIKNKTIFVAIYNLSFHRFAR